MGLSIKFLHSKKVQNNLWFHVFSTPLIPRLPIAIGRGKMFSCDELLQPSTVPPIPMAIGICSAKFLGMILIGRPHFIRIKVKKVRLTLNAHQVRV